MTFKQLALYHLLKLASHNPTGYALSSSPCWPSPETPDKWWIVCCKQVEYSFTQQSSLCLQPSVHLGPAQHHTVSILHKWLLLLRLKFSIRCYSFRASSKKNCGHFGSAKFQYQTISHLWFGIELSEILHCESSCNGMHLLSPLVTFTPNETSAAKCLLLLTLHHSSLRLTGFKPVVGFCTRWDETKVKTAIWAWSSTSYALLIL